MISSIVKEEKFKIDKRIPIMTKSTRNLVEIYRKYVMIVCK